MVVITKLTPTTAAMGRAIFCSFTSLNFKDCELNFLVEVNVTSLHIAKDEKVSLCAAVIKAPYKIFLSTLFTVTFLI